MYFVFVRVCLHPSGPTSLPSCRVQLFLCPVQWIHLDDLPHYCSHHTLRWQCLVVAKAGDVLVVAKKDEDEEVVDVLVDVLVVNDEEEKCVLEPKEK